MLDLSDISRSTHSLNLNIFESERIAQEQAEILYKQNIRKFHKAECLLWEKFDNAEILTNEELESQINQAYKKIVLEPEIN